MDKGTVYIVSGFMRTFTSMMMRSLEAGGMDAAYRLSRDDMAKRYADELYSPNEGGLYELERSDYQQLGFPKQYQGKLIKCLMGGLNNLNVMPKIKIIFMRRDVEEIVQSYEAFFNQKLMIDKEHFQNKCDLIIEQMRNRKDTEIIEVWGKNVIENPTKEFQRIKEFGFDIDVEKAATIVNPELYRFKLEDLTVGI